MLAKTEDNRSSTPQATSGQGRLEQIAELGEAPSAKIVYQPLGLYLRLTSSLDARLEHRTR